jgi:hypothetical protein
VLYKKKKRNTPCAATTKEDRRCNRPMLLSFNRGLILMSISADRDVHIAELQIYNSEAEILSSYHFCRQRKNSSNRTYPSRTRKSSSFASHLSQNNEQAVAQLRPSQTSRLGGAPNVQKGTIFCGLYRTRFRSSGRRQSCIVHITRSENNTVNHLRDTPIIEPRRGGGGGWFRADR